MYVVLTPFDKPNRRMHRTIRSVKRGEYPRLSVTLNDGMTYEFDSGGFTGNGVTEPSEYLPECWVCHDSDFDGEMKRGRNTVSGNPTPEGFASQDDFEKACAKEAADAE